MFSDLMMNITICEEGLGLEKQQIVPSTTKVISGCSNKPG